MLEITNRCVRVMNICLCHGPGKQGSIAWHVNMIRADRDVT
jgi:hypothetical protein